MSPHYRRISDLLDATGGHRWVDCVGISKSSSPSAESASIRYAAGDWRMGSDPVKFRQHYGKDFRMMGDLANAFGRQLQGDRTECSA